MANHVIELIKKDNVQDDPLLKEVEKLLEPKFLKMLRADLQTRLRYYFTQREKARKFNKLLSKIDEELSSGKREELRTELREGRPVTEAWPWPLCVIAGCR